MEMEINLGIMTKDQLKKFIVELDKENKKLEEEVEKRKEYQQRSQSADGEQIERLLGEKYKLEEENRKLKALMEHYKKFEEGKKELEGMLTEEGTLQ